MLMLCRISLSASSHLHQVLWFISSFFRKQEVMAGDEHMVAYNCSGMKSNYKLPWKQNFLIHCRRRESSCLLMFRTNYQMTARIEWKLSVTHRDSLIIFPEWMSRRKVVPWEGLMHIKSGKKVSVCYIWLSFNENHHSVVGPEHEQAAWFDNFSFTKKIK